MRSALFLRLVVIVVGISALAIGLAFLLQNLSLNKDLDSAAQRRMATAARMAKWLAENHLSSTWTRYRAISRTPQFRANLDVEDPPTLTFYVCELLKQQQAFRLIFLDKNDRVVAAAGDSRMDAKARAIQSTSLMHDEGKYYTVAAVTLKTADRLLGSLIAIETLDEKTVAQWSELCGAQVVFGEPGSDRKVGSLEAPVRQFDGLKMRVESSLEAERKAMANARRDLLVSALAAFFLAVIVSLISSRNLSNSILQVKEAAEKIGRGDFSVRVPSTRQDELGDLARSMNDTARRLEHYEEELRESNRQLEEALDEIKETQQKVIRQERLRALGQMASGIAHDFNNSLAPILGFSELILLRLESPSPLDKGKLRRQLTVINTAAQDAAQTVNRLREFYRHREEDEFFQPVRINHLVEEVITLTKPKWKDQSLAKGISIRIETDLTDVPEIAGNPAELREVLTNLVFNAVDALPDGGTITLSTRLDGDEPLLEVRDTGTGMTEEVRRKCLEPFFSTKGPQGSGLGLSMVFGIIERHKGTIDIDTELEKGTKFSIRFPTFQPQPEAENRFREGEESLRPLRILFVEDEPMIREIIFEYLSIDGHNVELANNGLEGLQKFYDGRHDLVVTDLAMPEMNGDELASRIKKIAPNKPIIMLTGFGEMMNAAEEKPPGVDLILSKPVTIQNLRKSLSKVTAMLTS